MRCAEADAFLHAYVDGELTGVDHDAYEQHLVECDRCSHCSRLQARFKASVRGHLPRPEVPRGLKQRIEVAIAASPPPPGRWRWQLYPKLVPAVLAASALAVIFFTTKGTPSLAVSTALRAFNVALPMDFVGPSCAQISEMFRGKVDFSVRPPSESVGARCEGGRLMAIGDRLAAYMVLRSPSGHRLAVMVWAGDEDEEAASDAPVLRLDNGIAARTARARGAQSLTFRYSDGLYYTVTSDLDEQTLANFTTVAFRP